MTTFVRISAILGFLAVALGAFGAHALKEQLEALDRVHVWKTATTYHLIHAVLLFFLCWKTDSANFAKGAWLSIVVGIILFSGSLYGLALSDNLNFLGPVTPLGGLAFLVGWAWLAIRGR